MRFLFVAIININIVNSPFNATTSRVVALKGLEAQDTRIASGVTASIYTFNYVVQLLRDSNGNGVFAQECAGSLITTRHILTAAHCFTGVFTATNRWQVRAGSPNRLSGGVLRNVVQIVNHPTFNAVSHVGDISVIVVDLPYVESTSIQRAVIAAQGSTLAANVATNVVGWGAINLTGTRSNLLLYAQVPVWNLLTCRTNYNQLGRVVTDDMICAGATNVGICTGDNGGPLVYSNQVHGLATWYTGCGNALYPGVFTRVGAFTNWIVAIANTT